MIEDTRAVWFCFDNSETIKDRFAPVGSEGTATVTIDNYTIQSYPIETYNTATLISVDSLQQE